MKVKCVKSLVISTPSSLRGKYEEGEIYQQDSLAVHFPDNFECADKPAPEARPVAASESTGNGGDMSDGDE